MRLYRLLLRLFPASFRARFGDDMSEVFADHRRTAARHGIGAVARLYGRTVVDVTSHGLAERRTERARSLFAPRRIQMIAALIQDVRYAFRTLRRRPGFTAVALVTLALGIGANTAIFSVVHAVLLRELPYQDADRIVRLYATHRVANFTRGVMNPYDFDAIQKQSTALADLSTIGSSQATLTGTGDPASIGYASVMPAFFDIVSARPIRGRAFTHDEAVASRHVTLISHRLWMDRFAGRDDAIGQTLMMDDTPWEVIGVMPTAFAFPAAADMWRPFELNAATRADTGSWFLGVIGKLKPGVSLAQAQQDVDRVYAAIAAQIPDGRKNRGVMVIGLQDDLASRAANGLRLLQGVVLLVLLIACANVANLLLAEATSRGREFGVRAAVGASRARLLRQMLTESVVLSLAGAAFGALLAFWGVRALVAMAPPLLLPSPETIGVSWTALGFTAAVALVTGVVFGLAPGLAAWTPQPATELKDGARVAAGGLSWSRRQWLRASLVAAEIGLALVLVAGAGLLVRSFALLMDQPVGFRSDRMLTAQLTLPRVRYSPDSALRLFETAVDRLRALPGVTGAAASNALPFSQWEWQTGFTVKGRENAQNRGAGIRTVTADYFDVLGIQVLRGRGITRADTQQSAPVAIVSDTFAREHLDGLDPIGQQITTDDKTWATIVGVVASTRQLRLDEPMRSEIYRPLSQALGGTTVLIGVRTQGSAAAMAPAVRDAIKALDPNLPLRSVKTMDELIAANVAGRRFNMMLLSLFAVLALVLAVVGVYGVMSYVVTQGRREIGIRLALGARPGQVSAGVLRQGLRVVIVGAILGFGGAWLLTKLVASELFVITPHDPMTLAAATVILAVTATAACWLPARRTARVDPLVALRAE